MAPPTGNTVEFESTDKGNSNKDGTTVSTFNRGRSSWLDYCAPNTKIFISKYDFSDAYSADLLIGAFFFAMRSCEHSVTPTPGRTRLLTLRNVIFRTKAKKELKLTDPQLHRAQYVTIVFVDQKNGKKFDIRTQQKTGDPVLCPVRRWASATKRAQRLMPNWDLDYPVCAFQSNTKQLHISNFLLLQVQSQVQDGEFASSVVEIPRPPREVGQKVQPARGKGDKKADK